MSKLVANRYIAFMSVAFAYVSIIVHIISTVKLRVLIFHSFSVFIQLTSYAYLTFIKKYATIYKLAIVKALSERRR